MEKHTLRSLAVLAAGIAAVGTAVACPPASAAQRTVAGDTLNHGSQLREGRSIASGNRRYKLIMQGDGNLVLYRGSAVTWSSRTAAGDADSPYAIVSDAFKVVHGRTTVWSNHRQCQRVVMQNDGNLVCYDANGRAVWSTGTSRSAAR